MSSNICPENEPFIEHELESGTDQNRGELLDDAVRLLKRRRELQRDIQAGIDSGPSIPGAEFFCSLEKKVQFNMLDDLEVTGGSQSESLDFAVIDLYESPIPNVRADRAAANQPST